MHVQQAVEMVLVGLQIVRRGLQHFAGKIDLIAKDPFKVIQGNLFAVWEGVANCWPARTRDEG